MAIMHGMAMSVDIAIMVDMAIMVEMAILIEMAISIEMTNEGLVSTCRFVTSGDGLCFSHSKQWTNKPM